MKNDESLDLTSGSISKHVLRIAFPASIGFFFNTMFNIVDTYYAGQLSSEALAALALSFPVFMLILSVSYGIGTAATSLAGNEIGAGNRHEVSNIAAQSFSLGLISSIALSFLGLKFSDLIFRLLGAEGSYLSSTREYTDILFIFVFAFILVQISSSLLSAHGNTTANRNFLMFSFFLNLILDPILMFGLYGFPKLGISGIALATIITQILGVPYLVSKLIKLNVLNKESFKKAIPSLRYFRKILYQAIPSSLNMLTVALGFFVTTYYVSRFGKSAVAAFGVGTRIEQIILLPAIGLNIAVLSLVSQNNGAKNYERIIQSYKYCMKIAVILMAIGAFFTIIFSNHLMASFTNSLETIQIGSKFLRIEAFVFIAYSSLYVSTSALQGIKEPLFAVWIGLIRQILLPLLAMYFLIEVYLLGIESIWWSRFFITILAAIFTAYYVHHRIRKLN